ncbi:CAAD domain-containing protein [Aerosakkonemataceae cyanobacterium BLCC-F154]|uniref:CAAD domain-containing protein n=1 Tax=Floridaenema fluviatile BLCC-F154 TaxID=3153640 RepID=A0ABV4YLQ2_9CYAN
MEPKFEKPADKAEKPTNPTPPEPEQIKKKEEKVAPPPPEDAEVKTEVASPPPPKPAEDLSVKAEMTPPTPPTTPTPPTPPTPQPTMQTPKPPTPPTPPAPPAETPKPLEFEISEEPVAEDFTANAQNQLQQIGKQFAELLDRLPDSVGNFYRDYQRPLTVVAGIIAIIIGLKLLSGVLDTFNEIPFFEPFFQLIGIIYSGWFVYRYLLNAGSRQELWQIIDDYKAQVFGNKKP